MGILTVGVVTKPFKFEGKKRREQAELGIKYLKKYVDSLVVVPNDKLMDTVQEQTSLLEAFSMADDVLKQGVQSISDIIVDDALINLDFADVMTIMKDRGVVHLSLIHILESMLPDHAKSDLRRYVKQHNVKWNRPETLHLLLDFLKELPNE